MQVSCEQQPPGHEAALHTQLPPAHACPAAHAAQASPPVPQDVPDCDVNGTQVAPLQQPFGQLVASHAQLPAAVQSWPAAQGWQVVPLAPHAPAPGVTHAPLAGSQQPLQFAGPHAHWFAPRSQVPPSPGQ